jgi:hypothetical protein
MALQSSGITNFFFLCGLGVSLDEGGSSVRDAAGECRAPSSRMLDNNNKLIR